ncbi:MAG TPA: chemotaxis protein CheW [Polyangiaceae bacterium]
MAVQLCTFHLGPLFLGVEVSRVQEVLRQQEMTRVPLAPPAVCGLINLRGQIVPAIELRECLQLEARAQGAPAMNVVVYTAGGAVSLIVDEVGDVMELSPADFEAAPRTIPARALEVIEGVYKLPNRLLLVVNVDRATALACQVSTGTDTRNGRLIHAGA